MKKTIIITLILTLTLGLLAGCGGSRQKADLSNPWVDYPSLKEAEEAVGFPLSVPLKVSHYQAETYRVCGGKLLEVTYRDGDSLVTVRKQKGEGLDLSGSNLPYKNVVTIEADFWDNTVKTAGDAMLNLISGEGFSYSLDAPTGYVGDANRHFISSICVEP